MPCERPAAAAQRPSAISSQLRDWSGPPATKIFGDLLPTPHVCAWQTAYRPACLACPGQQLAYVPSGREKGAVIFLLILQPAGALVCHVWPPGGGGHSRGFGLYDATSGCEDSLVHQLPGHTDRMVLVTSRRHPTLCLETQGEVWSGRPGSVSQEQIVRPIRSDQIGLAQPQQPTLLRPRPFYMRRGHPRHARCDCQAGENTFLSSQKTRGRCREGQANILGALRGRASVFPCAKRRMRSDPPSRPSLLLLDLHDRDQAPPTRPPPQGRSSKV